jgi:hypothetical protein
MEIYTRREINENTFEVLGGDGSTLKNHNGKPYPFLSENISRNLIGDLNHICEVRYKIEEATEVSEDKLMNDVLLRISEQELRESFAYCFLSTLMEYEEQQMDLELAFEDQIQWDRLFRLNASSDTGSLELNKTKKARDFFTGKWKNFGLNYSESLEEMNANEVEFVSDVIIADIQPLVASMDISKRVAVNILYNFFEYFSISIPILWVSGKITDEDFVSSYWALQFGADMAELNEVDYEQARFLMNRLLYLKTILWGYDSKDQTLPCVNFYKQ